MSPVSLREAVKVWAKIGLLSFGGPAGQVAVMHKELVEQRKWIDEERFLHALNYCMLLPGPEAQQLATYIGWLMHRTLGGVIAGVLFVLPGFAAMLGLSILYATWRELPFVAALFFGLKPAVLAIVFEAVQRIGRRALKNRLMVALAVASFLALTLLEAPFPLIIVCAGLFGLVGSRLAPGAFPKPVDPKASRGSETVIDRMAASGALAHTRPSITKTLRTLAVCGALWSTPFILLPLLGAPRVLLDEATYFSKAAVVTFGGAYAVLAYVAQQAVGTFGWLQPGEMLDGLGLAETTPGPLIMVVQFVAFMGAWRFNGALSPLVAGVLGSIVTVWVTFVPCFLWIFLGAPYIEALRGKAWLHAALSAITASVVGVIANLGLWFGAHVVFRQLDPVSAGPLHLQVPVVGSLDVAAAVLSLVALLAVFRFKLGVPRTLALCCTAGVVWKLLS